MGKWKMLILFLALTVVLWGCAGPEESRMDEALAFRAALVGAGGCSFMGEITADYGDEVHTFSAACTTDDTGALSFSLTAPETIAGIAGTVRPSGRRKGEPGNRPLRGGRELAHRLHHQRGPGGERPADDGGYLF